MGQMGEHLVADEFDTWLHDEFAREFVRFSQRPPPSGARYRAATSQRLSRRLKLGLLAAAVAVGLLGTGSLAAAAVTGSTNPQVWGQFMNDVVTSCKDQLASGQHGIGQCVSAAAHRKGTQNRDQPSNSGQGGGQKKHGPPTSPP